MKITYPAIIERDADGYYATFPDLDGCLSDGEDAEDVLYRAAEALEGYVLTLIESELPVPSPSSPSDIVVPSGSYIALIQSDINPAELSKSMNKTLTLPIWLNQRAVKAHINFSQVLQEALMKKLKIV